MKKELSKLYEPNKVEDKIYKYWLDGGFFQERAILYSYPTTEHHRTAPYGSCP